MLPDIAICTVDITGHQPTVLKFSFEVLKVKLKKSLKSNSLEVQDLPNIYFSLKGTALGMAIKYLLKIGAMAYHYLSL